MISKFLISSQRDKEGLDLLQVTKLLTSRDLGLQARVLVGFSYSELLIEPSFLTGNLLISELKSLEQLLCGRDRRIM